MSKSLYRDILLDHFRHPRNKGPLDADMQRERGSNPRCGDDIEVGLNLAEDTLDQLRFHGRGCSVCIASASMMAETCEGKSRQEVVALCESLEAWVLARTGGDTPDPGVEALDGARGHPARHTCILLSWRALQRLLTRRDAEHA